MSEGSKQTQFFDTIQVVIIAIVIITLIVQIKSCVIEEITLKAGQQVEVTIED